MNRYFHRMSERCVQSKHASQGFSLLELLVVVAIIGILVSYAGPRMFGQIEKSERQSARAQIDALVKSLSAYRIDMGRFPSSSDGLSALIDEPTNDPRWHGPYLTKTIPNDPWGRAYTYVSPGNQRDFDLYSFGPDGAKGGTGKDADINSW